jgi:hypothetical protein
MSSICVRSVGCCDVRVELLTAEGLIFGWSEDGKAWRSHYEFEVLRQRKSHCCYIALGVVSSRG